MSTGPATSSTMLIIIAIVCITIGYVFGWIVSSATRKREEKAEKPEKPEPVNEPAAPAEALKAAEPAPVPESTPPLAELSPVLKVWSGGPDGGLVVELGKRALSDPSTLTLQDRQKIEAGLRATADWMGLAYHLGEPAPAPVAQAAPQAAAAEPVLVMAEPMDLTRQSPVISSVTNALADALQPAAKKETALSIVQQIDEVLQGMLPGTPFEGKKIFISEDPRRGVIVRVENDIYEGIGSIPEGEVKQLLRSAVAEWERRQELNRRRKAM